MLKTLYNATAVLPREIREHTDLWLEGGKIAAIGDNLSVEGAAVIDAEGSYLMAGFVDIHVHGGGGADFMDLSKEAFETAVGCHLRHGTTTLYPTAVAAPFDDLKTFLEVYHTFAAGSELSSRTPGVHLEGPYFSGGGKLSRGAQKTDALRLPDMAEVKALLDAADGSIKRWDASPELEGAIEFARYVSGLGILVSEAHTDATAAEATLGFENGFSHVTHFYNATSLHRKREQTVYAGVVEATYLDDNVSVELILDGCHIPREDVLLALKIKGVQKVSAITDAMRIAGTDMTGGKLGSLKNGMDVIVEDGVAKLTDKSSFAGSIATMDRCLRVLCLKYGIDLPTASAMLSLSPAMLMGIDDRKGSIKVGKDADLVLLDGELRPIKVIAGGKIYEGAR